MSATLECREVPTKTTHEICEAFAHCESSFIFWMKYNCSMPIGLVEDIGFYKYEAGLVGFQAYLLIEKARLIRFSFVLYCSCCVEFYLFLFLFGVSGLGLGTAQWEGSVAH